MRDYQDLLQGTFRKKHIQFDLQKSFHEVVNLAQYKAKIKGINVKIEAKFIDEDENLNFVSQIKFDELKKKLNKIDDDVENHPLLVKVSKMTSCKRLPINVIGDCSRLKQVMLNLLHNAINNTFEGTVLINAHYDVQMSLLIFMVTDQGTGMSIEDQKTLF